MKRIAQAFLKQWKQSSERKPLVIRGARKVGKTWLMKEFGKNEYEKVVYIIFENDRTLSQLFDTNFDIERILKTLEIYSGKVIQKEKTLIIFDEIQELPKAVTSLKYFYENAPEYHIIAAGSLLSVALNRNNSFPVGKIAFFDLYPLNFIEFMWATEEQSLAELIQQKNWEIIPHFKDKFTALLKTYFFTGGMPEAVNQYVKDKNVLKVRTIQKNILEAYEQDFLKHAPKEIVPRIRLLWNSLPSQLAKENENLKAKSLKIYFEKYAPQNVFKFSLSDFREESWLTNVPLYAIDSVNGLEH